MKKKLIKHGEFVKILELRKNEIVSNSPIGGFNSYNDMFEFRYIDNVLSITNLPINWDTNIVLNNEYINNMIDSLNNTNTFNSDSDNIGLKKYAKKALRKFLFAYDDLTESGWIKNINKNEK